MSYSNKCKEEKIIIVKIITNYSIWLYHSFYPSKLIFYEFSKSNMR